jgi:hypothetical protein
MIQKMRNQEAPGANNVRVRKAAKGYGMRVEAEARKRGDWPGIGVYLEECGCKNSCGGVVRDAAVCKG